MVGLKKMVRGESVHHKTKLLGLILVIALVTMLFIIFDWNESDETVSDSIPKDYDTTEQLTINKTEGKEVIIPTVFVHGFTGDDTSMSGLLEGLSGVRNDKVKKVTLYEEDGKKVASQMNLRVDGQEMTYVVGSDERVHKFSFHDEEYMPGYVKVVFTRNVNNLFNQSYYLEAAMKEIAKDYQTEELNLVGHSMGGVSSSLFAFYNYNEWAMSHHRPDTYHVRKLVTLDSPFLGSFISLHIKPDYSAVVNIISEVIGTEDVVYWGYATSIGESTLENLTNGGREFESYMDWKYASFDPDMEVLSFAINKDLLVPNESACALSKYIQKEKYRCVTTDGTHSTMTYNQKTLDEIKSFL